LADGDTRKRQPRYAKDNLDHNRSLAQRVLGPLAEIGRDAQFVGFERALQGALELALEGLQFLDGLGVDGEDVGLDLAGRAGRIGERSMGRAEPGPSREPGARLAPDSSPPRPATSHLSAVDAWGHAVAMTTSIEDGFGSRIFVRGFLLNNQLTDFSFTPRAQDPDGQVAAGGAPIANRVQPGKRPLSSMSPTLVFDRGGGQLVASLGSPGGTWITSYLVKTLVGLLDWQLDAQQAIALPNFGSRNGPTELEADRFELSLVQALQARGHTVVQIPMTSGLQAIAAARPASPRSGIRWIGGADPRREGIAIGD